MSFDAYHEVQVTEHESEKWEVTLQGRPVRAFGTTMEDAYYRFIAIYELYCEYGEDWMAAVLADKSEEYVDAYVEMCEDPWTPDGLSF